MTPRSELVVHINTQGLQEALRAVGEALRARLEATDRAVETLGASGTNSRALQAIKLCLGLPEDSTSEEVLRAVQDLMGSGPARGEQ